MIKAKYRQLRENSFIYCSPKAFNQIILAEFNSIEKPVYYEEHKILQLVEIYIFQHRDLFDCNPPEHTMRRYIRALTMIAIHNYESEKAEGLIE